MLSHRLLGAFALFALLTATGRLSAQEKRPNLQFRISARLIEGLVGGQFDQVEQVDEFLLGKRVHGTGRIVGTIDAQLLHNEQKADINLQVQGTIFTNTTAGEGLVVIYNDGVIPFAAQQRVTIDERAVHVSQAQASAQASSQLSGVGIAGVMGLWPMRKIPKLAAQARYYRHKDQAESIASEIAREQIEARLSEHGSLARVRHLHSGLVSAEKERMRFEKLNFATNTEALFVNVLLSTNGQPRFDMPPPLLPRADDLALRLHQSAANEALFALFAGRTCTPTELSNQLAALLGPFGPIRQAEEPRDLLVRFADKAPFVVRFHEDTVSLFMHADELQIQGMVFEPVDIAVSYKIEQNSKGYAGERIGAVEVTPRDLTPGSKLTLRQELRTGVIRRRLERTFGERFNLDSNVAGLGTLTTTRARAENGWLLLNWEMH